MVAARCHASPSDRRWATAHRCDTLNRILNLFPRVEARDVGSVAVRSSPGGRMNAAFPTPHRISAPATQAPYNQSTIGLAEQNRRGKAETPLFCASRGTDGRTDALTD
jgi:hypothetical protein